MRTKRQLARDDAATLAGYYADAHNTLVRIIVSGQSSITSRARARAMLGQVQDVVNKLDARTQRYLENKIPIHYKRHAQDALKNIKKVQDTAKFTQIHEEAVKAFVDRSKMKFATGLTATTRKAQTVISTMLQNNITKELAKSKILGTTIDDTAKELVKQIEAQGITGLVDKRGRELNIASYARTLAYTELAESGRTAVRNVAAQNGFDLVVVSSHNSKHAECARFEGKVLSLSGATKGFMTMDEAISYGIFHPNCQHSYTIIDEQFVTDDMRS